MHIDCGSCPTKSNCSRYVLVHGEGRPYKSVTTQVFQKSKGDKKEFSVNLIPYQKQCRRSICSATNETGLFCKD